MTWKMQFALSAGAWTTAFVIYLTARDAHSANGELAALISAFVFQWLAMIFIISFEAVTELKAIRALLEAKQTAEKSN